jgi:F-box and WD-40 domain protein CDC4
MHISHKYIIVALDNGNLHIFDHEGRNERVVRASENGLWTVDAWEDNWVITGGVDGVLTVWDLGSL